MASTDVWKQGSSAPCLRKDGEGELTVATLPHVDFN